MTDSQALYSKLYEQNNPNAGAAGAAGADFSQQSSGGGASDAGKDDNVVDGDYREV